MNSSIFIVILLINTVTSLILWERRTLTCDMDDCLLSKGKNGTYEQANCQLDGNGRHECNIECDTADRDSVISKFPNGNRKCIRFYTYNTISRNGHWYLWRTERCSQQKITFELHCGVPTSDFS